MPLSSKDPQERVTVTFDFSNVETAIAGPQVTVFEKGTTIDKTTDMVSGSAQVTGNVVRQLIQGGESGKSYDVRCKVIAADEILVAKDVLPVKTL